MLIAESLIDEKRHIEDSRQRDRPLGALLARYRLARHHHDIAVFHQQCRHREAIGLTEVLTHTRLYYLYERICNRVPLGIAR